MQLAFVMQVSAVLGRKRGWSAKRVDEPNSSNVLGALTVQELGSSMK